ncbi:MAG TPA: YdeI/OmpD-associated family protein [Luteitalea sp.]|nr:YdeI/OmpD-associated family protein [Luteitalea sp.]
MPPTPPIDQLSTFRTSKAFETWMRKHHASAPEIWLRVYKKGSGIPSITIGEALDVALCWGWIDGIRKGLDDESYVQRYTPRRARSLWSQVNQDHVARLTEAGRMTPAGQAEIDRAKRDGRWAAAYAPMRSASTELVPDDLRAAIEASPRALAMYRTLSKQNLFAIAFRTNNMKTAAGRTRKIADLVAMLERGETIIPQKAKPTAS